MWCSCILNLVPWCTQLSTYRLWNSCVCTPVQTHVGRSSQYFTRGTRGRDLRSACASTHEMRDLRYRISRSKTRKHYLLPFMIGPETPVRLKQSFEFIYVQKISQYISLLHTSYHGSTKTFFGTENMKITAVIDGEIASAFKYCLFVCSSVVLMTQCDQIYVRKEIPGLVFST